MSYYNTDISRRHAERSINSMHGILAQAEKQGYAFTLEEGARVLRRLLLSRVAVSVPELIEEVAESTNCPFQLGGGE